jgi:hypothetical protein
MDKKNLARTYIKRPDIAQQLESVAKGPAQILTRPAAAGGASNTPATLTEEYLRFVLGTDEVPVDMREKIWALISRMNSMSIISGDDDFERIMHGVYAALTTLMWDDEITVNEVTQISHFVGLQLRRSKNGVQLKYLAPGYSESARTESSSSSVVDGRDQGAGNAAMGLLHSAGQQKRRY